MKPFPLVEYAKSIGKNTAEFTLKDFAAYMKWWLKQKPREDILKMGANYKADLAAMQKFRVEGTMGKADTSEIEIIAEEETAAGGEEVVCEMGLTKQDIEALLFSINRTFEDYDMEESNPYTVSLKNLKEGLEGTQ